MSLSASKFHPRLGVVGATVLAAAVAAIAALVLFTGAARADSTCDTLATTTSSVTVVCSDVPGYASYELHLGCEGPADWGDYDVYSAPTPVGQRVTVSCFGGDGWSAWGIDGV